ncbi:hypothetical protein KTO58_04755 [Chitinophaga pendula]|uniref:hypothetical protein n=1 Tax=Chitinophaga TaxID=79328 RepID=UPI000BAF610F|nr:MULTISPECIES: hypothetical protein [Chitinophaga]ASZ13877.1 hypothetical protein CK934_24430 [Chitinophaga sp. MD30]UCJ08503.1 hypothetical protein KTO58_04755 [Chitinophaga pendula]
MVKFIATIDDSADIDAVVETLKQSGFDVYRVRTITRNISASSERKSLKDLKAVKGIKHAEIEKGIKPS